MNYLDQVIIDSFWSAYLSLVVKMSGKLIDVEHIDFEAGFDSKKLN